MGVTPRDYRVLCSQRLSGTCCPPKAWDLRFPTQLPAVAHTSVLRTPPLSLARPPPVSGTPPSGLRAPGAG